MDEQAVIVDVDAAGFAACEAARSQPLNLDLARVFRLAERVVPSLRGDQCADPLPNPLRHGEDAADGALRTLCRHWERSFPEAGTHYIALRCWGLAIWQPIYLTVIAAHLDTHVPKLAGLVQSVENGYPRRFRLPVHAPVRGELPERMWFAAGELRAFCAAMRKALATHVALHARAADALQAECVLGALLQAHCYTPVLSAAALAELGANWLAQLGIADGCGFFAYRARDGTPALALDRRVCCHHFRRRDGEKCSTCPKLSIDARIARLLADPS